MIKRLMLVALSSLALLGVATPSIGQQKWVEYQSSAGGYHAEFPGNPTVTPQDLQTADGLKHVELVTLQLGQLFFVTAYTDINGVPPDSQTYLDRSRDGSVEHVHGSLRTSQQLSVGGLPARRFIYEETNKSIAVHLTVLSGSRLYQLEAVVPAGQENSAVVQHFIGSFAVAAR